MGEIPAEAMPEQRAAPFGRAELFPAMAGFPDALADVAEAPPASCDVRLISKVARFDRLATLPAIERLWCFSINAARLETLARCRSLRRLYLEELRVPQLGPLTALAGLEVLAVDGATKVSSLDELATFSGLRGLAIVGFPRVASLAALSTLEGLEALAVAGGMWKRMTVDTLAPLGVLTGLRYLHLANLKPHDESLAPLAALTNLRELELPNFYPAAEFARLARALPQTECAWFAGGMRTPLPCPRCGSATVLLTGKGMPRLCSSCDAERIARHQALFAR
jgi:hypothetical protein